jgi:hypothetical protein
MTMKQPRFSGPNPIVREAIIKNGRACTVALRFGRVLLYLEDRAALKRLVDAVEAAYELREDVFGSGHDLAEDAKVGRSSFERDGKPLAAARA